MYRKQQGAALLISLMLLVVLTLMAVSSINSSTVNLRIVGNMQEQNEMELIAQNEVEQLISDPNNFYPAANVQTIVNGVTMAPRVCLYWEQAQGYSASMTSLAPQQTVWEVTATYTTPDGAQVQVIQGTSVLMTAGNC